MPKKKNLQALRDLPIEEVAGWLNMDIVKTGPATWAQREKGSREVSSLTLFGKNNRWKRFSGKESGGCSAGSAIDLVMHIRDCDLETAIDFLTKRA